MRAIRYIGQCGDEIVQRSNHTGAKGKKDVGRLKVEPASDFLGPLHSAQKIAEKSANWRLKVGSERGI